MKKIVKGVLCAGLAVAMCAAVGCKDKRANDPETRQLKLATGALDGNFNPFTYTSANDGEMIGMTQLSLLTIDRDGKISYGENEVCAALDMKTTLKDKDGNVVTKGDNDGTTEYEITLKKGIMFSDGKHELTVKDVLFNLYVYLDPAYTGSTTIYSTKIVGLKNYRMQDPAADSKGAVSVDGTLAGGVNDRINAVLEWADGDADEDDQIKADAELAKTLFMKEISSDWTSILSGWEESYKGYNFKEAWEAYLFAESLVKVQERNNAELNSTSKIFNDINGNKKIDVDSGETYYTTLDPWQEGAIGAFENDWLNGVRDAQHFIDEVNEAASETEINKYIAEHADENPTADDAKLALQREACLDLVYKNYTDSKEGIGEVIRYFATGSSLYDEILGELRTKYYENQKVDGKLAVPNIEGITTSKNANGNDVLKIVINGVDPKAEYNFAFPVAPLYYYSGTYKGKDYVAAADPAKNEFGIEFGDSEFFKQVISTTEKNGVPVGAGAYRATTSNGGDNPNKDTFNANTTNCYFKRNDYFETVGPKIQNAKIKYVNYMVRSETKIMEALQRNEIDFGKPNATNTNVTAVTQNRSILASEHYRTGGYGYIGINPKAVPEYKVRQAIMKAIDTNLAITDFYGSDLAEPINRPMSTTSWAYPTGAKPHASVAYTTVDKEITDLVEAAGYTRVGSGLYRKTNTNVDGMANASSGSTLKFTFTIAGESTDHPAYVMFTRAADRLNKLGFDITVTTDPNALKSLISGDLAVWAAAWTSSTDPDMYQVYHKDSNATSVNNWNYKNILNGGDGRNWEHEQGIIEELSDLIDDGRKYLDRQDRVGIYSQCLDKIMELAVELPTYQRHDLCVYNHTVINSKSLVSQPNHYIGLFDRIWEIEYV